MFFKVNLDSRESVVDATDPTDAIRVARESDGAIDVSVQTAVPCSEDEQLFYASEQQQALIAEPIAPIEDDEKKSGKKKKSDSKDE